LRKLKEKKQKLKDEDVNPPKEFERIIMCHILQKEDSANGSEIQDGEYIRTEDYEIMSEDDNEEVEEEEEDEQPLFAYSIADDESDE